jgi:hypothetical protein
LLLCLSAAIWSYGMALHLLHGSPAAVACLPIRAWGFVVVASYSREWQM